MQISQEAGRVIWYSHLFQNFQFTVILTVKGFGLGNKAEVVFLEFSCFLDDPMDVDNLISGSSAFAKSSLNIWIFLVDILLKPDLENFEHYFASLWDEYNCVVVWTFFDTGMKLTFSSPVPLLNFFKFAGISSAALSQHYLLGFEITQLEFHHLH